MFFQLLFRLAPRTPTVQHLQRQLRAVAAGGTREARRGGGRRKLPPAGRHAAGGVERAGEEPRLCTFENLRADGEGGHG